MDGPVTSDGFPALANRGNINKNETTYDMDWAAMGQEDVKYKLNDAYKYDICPIDILSH